MFPQLKTLEDPVQSEVLSEMVQLFSEEFAISSEQHGTVSQFHGYSSLPEGTYIGVNQSISYKYQLGHPYVGIDLELPPATFRTAHLGVDFAKGPFWYNPMTDPHGTDWYHIYLHFHG